MATLFTTFANADQTAFDGFGRLRTSEPFTLFDLTHLYDKQPFLVEEIVTGAAVSTAAFGESAIFMDVNDLDDRIVRQSRRYFNYQPGKSLQVMLTGVMSVNSGGTFRIVKRSSVSGSQVDTKITTFKANAFDLDFSKSQIFLIDTVEWLGVGSVTMGVIVDGKKRILHQFDNANINNNVYMRRASLPIRYEITKTKTTTISRIGYFDNLADGGFGDGLFFEYEVAHNDQPDQMKMICSTVISEGGYNQKGKELSVDSGSTSIAVTTERPVLSIRLKTAYNRATLIPLGLSMLSSSASNFIYRVYYGGTLTGASFANVDANSATEFDVAATAITGGVKIKSGYVSTQTRAIETLFDGLLLPSVSIAGVPEIVTITAQNLSGGSANIFTQLSFQEII
jgi:hypothetical protein